MSKKLSVSTYRYLSINVYNSEQKVTAWRYGKYVTLPTYFLFYLFVCFNEIEVIWSQKIKFNKQGRLDVSSQNVTAVEIQNIFSKHVWSELTN